MSSAQSNVQEDLRDHYIDLLCRTLTRYEMENDTIHVPINPHSAPRYLRRPVAATQSLLRRWSLDVAHVRRPALAERLEGMDWPRSAETMVGIRRLQNLHHCLRIIFSEDVPGDMLEAGVWRGGASIFMRGVALAYGQIHRQSWVADSFRGLPPPDSRYSADDGADFHYVRELSVPLEEVKRNFEKYGLLDDGVRFLSGWFRDTLPQAPVQQLALLRLDGDMYSSTIETLTSMYDRVTIGGFIVIDDYNWIASCKQATDDFRADRGIEDELVHIDSHGVHWRKVSE